MSVAVGFVLVGPGAESVAPTLGAEEESRPAEVDAHLLEWWFGRRWWRAPPARTAPPTVPEATADSLTATWTEPPDSGALPTDSYDIEYRVAGDAHYVAWAHAGDAATATITGLAETTTYEIRVRAENEFGAGDWSLPATGRTLLARPRFAEGESATREVPENVFAGSPVGDPVTATVGRRSPTYALHGPDAAAFRVDRSTGQISTRDGVAYDHEVRPRYEELSVAATAGEHAASIALTVLVTDVDEPPAAPPPPEVESASRTGLTIAWEAPGNTGPRIADYDVEYRPPGDDFVDAGHDGRATTARLTGLESQTRYELRVRATNAEGTGVWSQLGTGTTTGGRGGGGGRGGSTSIPIFGSVSGFTIAENTVAVGTVRARNAATHTIANSADGAAFEIDNAGALRFRDAPDYELPTDAATSDPPDAARNNIYVVTVVATGSSGSARQTVTVTVTDTPFEAPAVTVVTVLSSTEISLSWSRGDNAGPPILDYDVQYRPLGARTFSDGDYQGLGTSTTLDGLTPATRHEIQVRAVNANGPSPWSESSYATTDSNRAPEFAQSTLQRTLAENTPADQPVGAPLAASDPDRDPLTYRLGGRDAARFVLESDSAQLLTRTGIDYDHETRDTLDLTVTAEDDHGGRATATVEVAVADEREPPGEVARPATAASTLDSLTVLWNVPANTGPPIDDYDYRYRRDPPGENWTEVTNTTITATRTTISSLQAQTRYAVEVRALNDEGEGAWSDTEYGTTDNNQAPTFNEGGRTTRRLAENTSGTHDVGAPVQATDRDGGTLAYSLEGTAAGRFDIVADSGQLTTLVSEVYDHEEAARHDVTVRVVDGQGSSATIAVSVEITDLDEPPETPAAPLVSTESSTRLRASWSAPYTTGPAITDYDYRYGTDGVRWTTVANAVSTDTEVELADLDPHMEYQVQVRATNDEGTSDWSESGRATTEANQAPTFSEGAAATRALPENTAADADFDAPVAATDANDDRLAYRLGGSDAGRFAVDADSGQLRTRRFDYDYEARADYAVTVTVEDTQGATASIDVSVEVTDLDEAPGAPSPPSRARGTSTTLTMRWPAPSNTGPDIDDYDYRFREMAPGTNWDEVTNTTIDTPQVTIEDLEPDTTYQVEARAHNDEGTSPWSGTGTARTNANRPPVFADGSRTTRSLPENTVGVADIGNPVAATDPDGDDLTYTLTGTDVASFALDAATGKLRTRGNVDYDHEAKSAYQVIVEVEDEWRAPDSILVTVDVADQLEPPAIPAAPAVSVFAWNPYSIEASWSAPANAGRPAITGYDVRYGIAGSGTFSTWRRGLADTEETITGLMPETAYEVQVLANNDEGSSGWSPSGHATTLFVVPVVESVAFTSDPGLDDSYKLGDTIEVTVTFSEAVTVDTTGGEPGVDIVVGSRTRRAAYVRTSGPDALVFEYEVGDDDEDTDGASIRANGLVVPNRGGTIVKAGRTIPANLSHARVDNADGHKVDGVAPTLSGGAVVNIGTLTLAYSETLAPSPLPAAADFDVRVAGSARTVSTVAIRAQSVILTLASEVAADENVTITYAGTGTNPIRDVAGNPAPGMSSRSVDNLTTGVCARTAAVRDAITRAAGAAACEDVTATNLAEMTVLDVAFREVTTLKDGDFAKLPALYLLTLQDNELTDLPAGIFSDLPSLLQLDLNNNDFATLPDVFGDLNSLALLNLNGNQLSSLPSGIFSGLTALRWLRLARNAFATLPANAFSDVSTVIWLSLDDNDLADLSGDAFAGLPDLEILWLADNELSSLPDGLLSGLTALQDLDLNGNLAEPLPIPVTLQLSGSQVQARIPVGAPFDTIVPIQVDNGTLAGGVTAVTVSQGDTHSAYVAVQRSAGTTAAVTVDIGRLPKLPELDRGYRLVRADDLPLEVIPGVPGMVLRPSAQTVREGGSNGYTVALLARPSGTVSVSVTTPTGLTADPSPLSFAAADWDTPQTVTLTAAADADSLDNVLTVDHQATGGGYSLTESLTATVAESVADTNTNPSFTSTTTFTVAENEASVATVTATDGDPEDSVTGFTLGGADGGRFEITRDGALGFGAPPDFERPADVGSTSPANDADNNEYVVAVTATSGFGSRQRTATRTIVVTVQDIDEPPGQPPAPVLETYSSDFIDVMAGRRPIDNTGPKITGYDLRMRFPGYAFWEFAKRDVATITGVQGLYAGRTYEMQARARNDEGEGPWSPSGEATTLADGAPQVLSVALPSGVTATAGGPAQLFELPSAFQDPEGEFVWLEATSRSDAVATASLEGPAVVVRPLGAGQTTVTVTALDRHGQTMRRTVEVTVRPPAAKPPR